MTLARVTSCWQVIGEQTLVGGYASATYA